MDLNRLYDLRASLQVAKSQKNWQLLLKLAADITQNFADQATIWDFYWYVYGLYKTGNTDLAFNLCSQIFKQNSEFIPCRNLLAMIIFSKVKQLSQPQYARQFYEYVLFDLKPSENFLAKAVLGLADVYLAQNQYSKLLDLFEQFKDLEFSRVQLKTKDGRILPSDYQKFQFRFIKTLFKLSNYEQFIKYLESSDWQHLPEIYSVWVKYYLAVSYSQTEQYKKAMDLLMTFPLQKQWFTWFEMAKIAKNMNNSSAALYFAVYAIVEMPQKMWYKVKAIKFIISLLEEKESYSEQLKKLKCFVLQLYKQNSKDEKKILPLQNEFGISFEQEICQKDLTSEIKKILHSLMFSEHSRGVIIAVKEHYGFIKDESGKTLYFYIGNSKNDKKILSKGQAVSYSIGWRYDRKKRKISAQALNLRLL